MTPLLLAAGFLVAAVTAVGLVPILRRLALRCHWVDSPDGCRKLHDGSIPNVGGLAIVVSFSFAMAVLATFSETMGVDVAMPPPALWVGMAVITITGVVDDLFDLRFNYKFAAQVVVAFLVLHAGYRIDVSSLPYLDADPYLEMLYSVPLTILWVVWIVNAVNLLDGLDGLAAGVTLIAFASLGAVYGILGDLSDVVLMCAIAGALSGFLIFNFNPASIFMGDSGSMFIGYLLAAFSLSSHGKPTSLIALLIPLVVLALPVADTVVAVVRRLVAHRSIFTADTDHIHHRLLRRMTHRRAVLMMYGVSLAFGLLAVGLSVIDLRYWLGVAGVSAGVLVLWLRRLGYLRLRASIRLFREHYAQTQDEALLPRVHHAERPTPQKEPVGHTDRTVHEPALSEV